MSGLNYTLLCDGSSDQSLMYVIEWALRHFGVRIEKGLWADLSSLRQKPKELSHRVALALECYPCDILFVHRDAEKEPYKVRLEEIRNSCRESKNRFVPVIPVRMTEAWLLHDEQAIRTASGKPNGSKPLDLPTPKKVESEPDPKDVLNKALITASEMNGRKLNHLKRDLPQMRSRVAELIDDYSPLMKVDAFAEFLKNLRDAL